MATIAISEQVLNEFRRLVFEKHQKFGKLRIEAEIAIKKRCEELKHELTSSA